MTLNQVIKRIELLALSHKQINTFFIGEVDEFLQEDVKYPALFCEIKPGKISKAEKQTTFNFTFYLLDLLAVSSNAMANEWEIKSDMTSIAEDMLAMMDSNDYSDTWTISTTSSLEFHDFKLHDLCSGVSLPVSVSVRFFSDRCQVPTSIELSDTGLKGVPSNALTDENGNPILTETGEYILYE